MRLRQICLVAADLRPVEDAICDALGLEVCFRDAGLDQFGLRHGLYAIGDHLLEVVVPKRDGTTAERYLERQGGDGGYMVLVQIDDLEAERERVTNEGFSIIHEASGDGIDGIHLHPREVGGAILSIDQATPPESWGWAGHDWKYHAKTDVVNDLVAAEIQCIDPAATAATWSRALAHPVGDNTTIELADATIRFVEAPEGQSERLTAIDLVATDRSRSGETLDLCGTRFNLV